MSTTISELQAQNENRAFVRKTGSTVGFIAPADAEMPTSLTDESGAVKELPEAWKSVGLVTPDGFTFGMDVESDEIEALGHASPVRKDITGVTRSVSFTALEYGRRDMLQVLYGQDIPEDALVNGEVTWDEVDLPVGRDYKLLIITGDGPLDNLWLLGRGFTRVQLTDRGEQAWAKEGAIEQEYTFDVLVDDEIGTPVRHYMGGTAVAKNAEALGFDTNGGGGVEG